MADVEVSSEQRARLLELEARQRQLKRLCEEALKEDEEHQHIFQQLEEHNMTSSTAGSFRGTGPVAGTATQPGQAAAAPVIDDPMDDLMTGEVRSFRDPNSITRASSTGSVGGFGTGTAPYPRNASIDRPTMTRLDGAYRPPTYPTAGADTAAAPAATGFMPPPPPPRSTLYSTTRQPRAQGSGAARVSHGGLPSPPHAEAPTNISNSWRQSGVTGEAVRPLLSSAQSGSVAAAGRPSAFSSSVLPPPPPPPPPSGPSSSSSLPPPPPPPERSRSLSHSMPLTDRHQRSGDYHLHTMPPPPPPESTSSRTTRASPHSRDYTRSPGPRVGLTSPSAMTRPPPPPPPPAASGLVSPEEVTDDLLPPPPRRRGPYTTPEVRPSAAEKYRGSPQFLHNRLHSPPPPPPPPAARVLTSPSTRTAPPPPAPSPPNASENSDVGVSFLSSTSTEHDVARWRSQLQHSEARSAPPNTAATTAAGGSARSSYRGSWAMMQSHRSPARRGLASHFDAAAMNIQTGRQRRKRSPPPPPPPPPPLPTSSRGVGVPPPPPSPPQHVDDNGDGQQLDRWDTASLTPSQQRAEESRLRHYFASNEKVAPRSYEDYLSRGTAASPQRGWRTSAGRGAIPQRHRPPHPPSALEEWATASRTRVTTAPISDRSATALRYDFSVTDDSRDATVSDAALTSPPPPPPPAPEVERSAAPRPAAPKLKQKPSHPYGGQLPVHSAALPTPTASNTSNGALGSSLLPSLYAQQQRSTSAGLNSSRNSIWEHAAPSELRPEAGVDAAKPAVVGASEFFDMGPEKEALLTLLRESTRGVAATTTTPAAAAPAPERAAANAHTQREVRAPLLGFPHLAAAPVVPIAVPTAAHSESPLPSMVHKSDGFRAQRELHKVPSLTSLKSPRRLSSTGGVVESSVNAARGTRGLHQSTGADGLPPSHANAAAASASSVQQGSPQLQRQCDEAQAKAEALARHLVKAITDRKTLQSNVEELEQLVEECNVEVGRLQHIVEEQHSDASNSLGVQAALRAKEREVAVYEDEIRRLNGVLDDHLARTSMTRHVVQDSMSQSLVTKEAEVEAAMAEVGMAHVAQRDAEERAGQLANELETAVEQIQFLDERLAEMERAAAAAQFEKANAHIRGGGALATDSTLDGSVGAILSLPSAEDTRGWPVEARRAMAQVVAQAQRLLQQNAEGERHAAMRLQHVEHTCDELQHHLRQRGEEVERAKEACQVLAKEKTALQACGEQWYQQLREVKEDAQLVSEMMRTARDDAEEVYLSSRVAEERVALQQAAAAAASPFRPAPAPSAVDLIPLQKSAQFAQQVMGDFHAVARFLSSLRKMDIGDRNGYQILQSIAKGRNPAEGLFITADDAATPKRMIEHLSPHITAEAKQRVQEKKARVLQAVERALRTSDSGQPPQQPATPLQLHNNTSSGNASEQARPPTATIPLGLPPRAEPERATTVIEVATSADVPAMAEFNAHDDDEGPDAFLDEAADELEPEVEVVSTALQPARLSSYSYRGGSSGMVHSDLRRGPADLGLSASHNSSQATPPVSHPPSSVTRPTTSFAVPQPAPATTAEASVVDSIKRQQRVAFASSAAASPGSPIPLAVNGKPVCSALYMGDEAQPPTPATARPATAQEAAATASPTPPPPSVSRPLRLSTTPSQPQSDLKEEEKEEEKAVVAKKAKAAGPMPTTRVSAVVEDETVHSVLTAQSTPLRGDSSGLYHDASSITMVSSPSLSPQTSEWPQNRAPSQLEQQQHGTRQPVQAPTSATPTAAPATTSAPVVTAPHPQPTTSFLDGDASLPSISDVAPYRDVEVVAPLHLEDTPKQQQQPPPQRVPVQLQSPDKDEAPHASRLRSPTPDLPPPQREVDAHPTLDIITSPLQPPRPSRVSVDEPLPRPVREDSQPLQPGSHPKDRSTTARPPSTPPAPPLSAHYTVSSSYHASRKPHRDHGASRRGASDDDSNDDEATLFFHGPARGVVHEVEPSHVTAPPTHRSGKPTTADSESRVEVDLLCDDFVMPSQKPAVAAPATAASTAALAAPFHASTGSMPDVSPVLPALKAPVGSTESKMSDAAGVDNAHIPPPLDSRKPSIPPLPHSGIVDKTEKAAPASPQDAADGSKTKRTKERSKSPRSRPVVVHDDDDEPSLQFTAPPLPPPPPTALPRPLNTAHVELSTDTQPPPTSRDVFPAPASPTSTAATLTDYETSTSLPFTHSDQQSGPAHRPPHQPRRPQSTDAGLSLSVVRSGVAPPRLQRSATPSPSAAAPLSGPSAPSLALSLSNRADAVKQRTASSSLDRPPPDVTPVLAEPQRASRASRPEPTGLPASSAPTEASTTVPPLDTSTPVVPIHAEEISDVVSDEIEGEEGVAELDVRSGTATPNRGVSRVPATLNDEPVAVLAAEDDDFLRSDSRTSAPASHQTPRRRLPSNAATATPGSPPESGEVDRHLRSAEEEGKDNEHTSAVKSVEQTQATAAAAAAHITPSAAFSSSGIGLPRDVRNDSVGSMHMNLSQPADPLPVAPGQSREHPGRAGESRSGATSPRRAGQGGIGSDEPAPLPTVNVDAPESNTLGLRRAPPKLPAMTSFVDAPALVQDPSTPVEPEAVPSLPSSPRSRSSRSNSSLANSPSSEAAARRRDDVARILERIRAKRDQEQKSGATTPTAATAASSMSSSRPESDTPSFNGE